jgi:hypothetical protein
MLDRSREKGKNTLRAELRPQEVLSRYALQTLAVVVLLLAGEGLASASLLPYSAPWNVTLGACAGNGACKNAFGTPPTNGVVAGTTSYPAVVSAWAESTSVVSAGNASTSVEFNRPLTLPAGGPYTICLSAALNGTLEADNTTDSAAVTGCAVFGPVGGVGIVSIGCQVGPWMITAPPPVGALPVAIGTTTVCSAINSVAAGNYEVRGSLSVSSLANTTLTGHGLSNFFAQDGSADFVVSGNYQVTQVAPAPAPALGFSTVVFMAVALVAIGWVFLRRSRPLAT